MTVFVALVGDGQSLTEFLLAVDEEVDTGEEAGDYVIGLGADVHDDFVAREGLEGDTGDG